MSGSQTRTRSWCVLGWWILASLAGWAAGLALGALLTMVGSKLFGLNEDRALVYITMLSLGLACGAAQSTVLRGYLPGAWRWIPVTLAGYLLAVALIAAANNARVAISDPIALGLIGAAIGVSQWLLLRQYFRRTGLWVLATAVGFLSFLWLASNPASSLGEFIAVGTILGTLAAVAPGVVLAWVVRLPRDAIS